MSSAIEPTARHDQTPGQTDSQGNGFTHPGPLTGTGGSHKSLPSHGRGGRRVAPFAFGLLLLLAVFAAVGWYAFLRPADARADVLLHTVKKEPLVVTVAEKGTIESAGNRDIVCKVRAGTKGYSTTINWVIEDGARVKAGQLLMILDDSALKDQEESQLILVQTALAEKITAEKDYEIAVKQNAFNVATAENALTDAENALELFVGLEYDPTLGLLGALGGGAVTLSESGAFQQEVDTLNGEVRLTESEVEQNREWLSWANNMVKLAYMSPAQAQAGQSRLDASTEKLRALRAKRAQLLTYDRKQRLTNLKIVRDNALLSLEKAELEADANLVKALSAKQSKTSTYLQQDEKLRDLIQQRAECKVFAPDGIEPNSMVVYYKNESSRWRSTSEGMIEQGAQVKEGQKMLRIPNLRRMLVNTKVHEAMVARLRGDVRVPTYFGDGLQNLMLLNTDPFARIVGQRQEVQDGIRQQFRNLEYRKVSDGQTAMIRVDALPDRVFEGHVRTVANVASQADSWVSDTKLYQTFVTIDSEVLPDGTRRPLENEQLKPDMTAEVSITVDTAKEPVLTVPVQAVMGGTELGASREVFVKTPTGYDRRPVKLGLYNEKVVEIREGLAEGDQVVINPKVLLGDEKTKTREAGDGKAGKKGKDKDDGDSEVAPKGEGYPKGGAKGEGGSKGEGGAKAPGAGNPGGAKKKKSFGGAGAAPGGGGVPPQE
jgi:HlyD family secretion protein